MGIVWIQRLIVMIGVVARDLVRLPQYATEAERMHRDLNLLFGSASELQATARPSHQGLAAPLLSPPDSVVAERVWVTWIP